MKKVAVVLTLALVCFAIMAVNSNTVSADEDINKVIKKLNQSKRIVEDSVMPVEDIDTVVKKLKSSKRILKKRVLPKIGAVPRTGQTTSYATGDDGDLQMGTAWPTPRFTDNGDGTVTDNLTGLIWLKDASCFGIRSWYDALNDCNNLADGQCGLGDGSIVGEWRLPNRFELESLLDLSQRPCLPPGHPFAGVPSSTIVYWSSTVYNGDSAFAWYVVVNNGNVWSYEKSINLYVWPVRGGQ
jgi:hypothetical protein